MSPMTNLLASGDSIQAIGGVCLKMPAAPSILTGTYTDATNLMDGVIMVMGSRFNSRVHALAIRKR